MSPYREPTDPFEVPRPSRWRVLRSMLPSVPWWMPHAAIVLSMPPLFGWFTSHDTAVFYGLAASTVVLGVGTCVRAIMVVENR